MAEEVKLAPIIGGLIGIMMVFMLASMLQAAAPLPPLGIYKCPYCDMTFNNVDDLIAHTDAVHPDKPPIRKVDIDWD